MGIMEDVKNSRKNSQDKKKPKKTGYNRFITFHPTEAEKSQLALFSRSTEQCLNQIGELLQEDVSFTIIFKPENQAYGLTLRDKSLNWEEDVPLSVWHSDLWKALSALCYALETRWKDYPSDHPGAPGEFLDLW